MSFPKQHRFLPALTAIAATIAVSCVGLYLFNQDSLINSGASVATTTEVSAQAVQVATVTHFFKIQGDRATITRDGELIEISKDAQLMTGDAIEVPAGARIRFKYEGEDTTINFQGSSQFVLNTVNGAKHIELIAGELHAEVAPQPVGKPLRVTTEDAEAVVLGTTFELRRQAYTRLSVLTGKVEFNSMDDQRSVQVIAGHLAKSDQAGAWQARPFTTKRITPIFDHTLNENKQTTRIAIDPKRNYAGFIRFYCGTFSEEPIEAKLRLRVAQHHTDGGGRGVVRLYQVPADTHYYNVKDAPLKEVASYSGKLGVGMNLDFDIDTSALASGINTFVVKLDKDGNDFWFSSSEGKSPPQLILKLETE